MDAIRDRPAPELILMPGLDGTGALFAPLLAALPASLATRVIRYPPDECLSLEDHAQVVSAQLTGAPVVLLAESFSSLVALALLRRGPPAVKAVIFCAGFSLPPRPYLLSLATHLPITGMLMRSPPKVLLRRYCLGKQATSQRVDSLYSALAAVSPRMLAHRLRLIAQPHDFAGPPLPVACHVIQAAQDLLVPAIHADRLGGHFRSYERISINGPHFLLQTRPVECAQIIANIVGRCA